MRETPISSLERTFLLEALSEGKRIDVRGVEDRRHVIFRINRIKYDFVSNII